MSLHCDKKSSTFALEIEKGHGFKRSLTYELLHKQLNPVYTIDSIDLQAEIIIFFSSVFRLSSVAKLEKGTP